MSINESKLKEAAQKLLKKFGDKVVTVAVFGSFARDEFKNKSDLDFFVVVRNWPKKIMRRRLIYDTLHKCLKTDLTLIDVDEKDILKEDLKVTPLLLNIAYDAKILYDRGNVSKLFRRIREGANRFLERYKTPNGCYGWKPKKEGPLQKIRF